MANDELNEETHKALATVDAYHDELKASRERLLDVLDQVSPRLT